MDKVIFTALAAFLAAAHPATAQLLLNLPQATLPLSAADRFYVVQGGVSKQAPISGLPASGQIPATQTYTVSPTGNPTPSTLTSLNVQGSSVSQTTREFLVNVGFNVNTGSSEPTGSGLRDKVALYSGAVVGPSAGDVWPANFVVTMPTTANPTSNVLGLEIDIFNDRGNCGSGPPACYGLVVGGWQTTAHSPYYNTAAVGVFGNNLAGSPAATWLNGITIGASSISNAAFFDASSGAYSTQVQGSHTYGYDTTGATISSAALHIGSGQAIASRNHAGSADLQLIATDSSDQIVVGSSSVANVFFSTSGKVIVNNVPLPVFGTPASSSAACVRGTIMFDSTYAYWCIATNTWHRASNGATW